MAPRDNFTTILLVGGVGLAVFLFTRRQGGLEDSGGPGLFGGIGNLFGGAGELASGGGELLGGVGDILGAGGDILGVVGEGVTGFVEEAGPGVVAGVEGAGGLLGGAGELIGGVFSAGGEILGGTGELVEETGTFFGRGLRNIPERLAAGTKTIFRFFSNTAITSLRIKGIRLENEKARQRRQADVAANAQRRLEIQAGKDRAGGRSARSIRFRGFRIPVDSTGLPTDPGLRASFLTVSSGL